jgi:restriction system protein
MTKLITASFGLSFNSASKKVSSSIAASWNSVFIQPLIIQAIVERIDAVEDGHLVKVLEPAWRQIENALKLNPNALHELTPEQLEQLIAAAYDKAGYDEVILTPRSGDYGRDVIAVRKGWGSIRIIDQVKAFKKEHLVNANDVRALLGVLNADRSATKGIVTTTSDFAPKFKQDPFIAPYIPYRLELVNGVELIERLTSLGKDK